MPGPQAGVDADLVVYGATAGGVVAAIAAADAGLRVVLAEPSHHVGGMFTGGLSRTDIERQEELVGGMAQEVFARIGRHYGAEGEWRFEPKIAERVLREWLDEAGVVLTAPWRLAEVERRDARVAAAVSDEGARLTAPCFIDASYEGDLLAGAGVTYDSGRDGTRRYGESLAGRAEMLPNPHQFSVPVSALSPHGGLLPYVQPYESIGPLGHGDGKLQSYCHRLCLTDDPAVRIDLPEPDDYDPDGYALLQRYLSALGDAASIRHFMGVGRLPNGKVDINSGGPVSTNLLGASWEYPEADWPRRRQIAEEHLQWTQGLLFFLATDPSVPTALQTEVARFGLAADEFPRTGHWPPQLYVREARRMRGEHVLTQHDVQGSGDPLPDAVGLGGYNIDIREVQWVAAPVYRFPAVHAEVLTEGYVSVPVDPYPLPYRALLPRQDECTNLLVTTCISASHVAFSSFRMEPQFMITGHAGGIAAMLAVEAGGSFHAVDPGRLQRLLLAQGQKLPPATALLA